MNRGWGHAEMSGSATKAVQDPSSGKVADAKMAGKTARSKNPAATSVAIESMRLLGKWTLLSQRQISADMGCACCVGFGNMRGQDFEQQILDYLHDKYSAAGDTQVVGLLASRAAFRYQEAGSIAELLRALATPGEDWAPSAGALTMLGDLGNSIDSIDRMGL